MKINTPRRKLLSKTSIAGILSLTAMSVVATASAGSINLGTAADFAVLAGTTVTNTGPTVITGNVGVSPGTAITGFPPAMILPPSSSHTADAVALQAQTDLTTAYNTAAGLSSTQNLTGIDLGGLTLLPGVYFFASSAQLTGNLTLDALGDPDSEFIFQIGSTLTTASRSAFSFLNGADLCNVYFQVGSSATLGTNSDFAGTIMALTSISLTTGTTLEGRALARNGAVTLDTNTITRPACDTHGVPDSGHTLLLLTASLFGLGGLNRRFARIVK